MISLKADMFTAEHYIKTLVLASKLCRELQRRIFVGFRTKFDSFSKTLNSLNAGDFIDYKKVQNSEIGVSGKLYFQRFEYDCRKNVPSIISSFFYAFLLGDLGGL